MTQWKFVRTEIWLKFLNKLLTLYLLQVIQSDKRTEIWLKFLDKRLTLASVGDPVGQGDPVKVCPDRDQAQISGQAFNPIASAGDPVGQSDPMEVCPDRDLAQIPEQAFKPIASAGDPV
jgi:hypothetical protein